VQGCMRIILRDLSLSELSAQLSREMQRSKRIDMCLFP